MTIQIIVPLITMVITLLYVVLTYKQVKASRESVDAMKTQTLLDQQPCIVVNNITSFGTKVFNEYGRRQLGIQMNLCNIGSSPALSVYVFSHFESPNGRNSIEMYYLPDYLTHIKANDEREASVRYEEKEIKLLVDDLEVSYNKNIERLRDNPSKKHYPGSFLVIDVFYKNQLGQWFCHSYKTEVSWLNIIGIERKSDDINETTIPPNILANDIEFELQLTSELLSESNNRLADSDEVKSRMEAYNEF
ncbi:MAG: hypothetical protein IJJ01_09620 [Firmicutes bacterium]|nr:hypothetical protein [Bacillota bacterium]